MSKPNTTDILDDMGWWILRDRQPVRSTFAEYSDWMMRGFEETRRIARDKVGAVEVSTVFLSMDHNRGGGPPVLFETMTFGPSEVDQDQWRYSTWDEAMAGHLRVVASLKDEPA